MTEYAGKFVLNQPTDKEYSIKVKGGFIDGERNPIFGKFNQSRIQKLWCFELEKEYRFRRNRKSSSCSKGYQENQSRKSHI